MLRANHSSVGQFGLTIFLVVMMRSGADSDVMLLRRRVGMIPFVDEESRASDNHRQHQSDLC